MSSKFKQNSIVIDNHELLKIIPIGKPDRIEFKIIIDANISHWYWPVNYTCVKGEDSIVLTSSLFQDSQFGTRAEYTYHRTLGDKKAKIHLITTINGEKNYSTINFKKMIEPNSTTIIPIPLCKLVFSDYSIFPTYHPSKNKEFYDISGKEMRKPNVIEIYMFPGDNDKFLKNLKDKWSLFYDLFMHFSIEHFAVPNISNMKSKYVCLDKEHIMKCQLVHPDSGIGFWITAYYNDRIENNPDASNFSLIENSDFLKILSCTPIQFRDKISGVTSAKTPAFRIQLDENRDCMSSIEYKLWLLKFQKYEKELRKRKITLPGVIYNVPNP